MVVQGEIQPVLICVEIFQDPILGEELLVYEQLYRNLGTATLHIGGHTADLSQWEPDGTASCAQRGPVVTKSLVQGIFAFAHRIQWKVTWGLNLIANDPAGAASEAAYIAEVGEQTSRRSPLAMSRNSISRMESAPAIGVRLTIILSGRGYEMQCWLLCLRRGLSVRKFAANSAIFSSFIKESRGDTSLLAISRHFYTRGTDGPTPTVTGLLGAPGAVNFGRGGGRLGQICQFLSAAI